MTAERPRRTGSRPLAPVAAADAGLQLWLTATLIFVATLAILAAGALNGVTQRWQAQLAAAATIEVPAAAAEEGAVERLVALARGWPGVAEARRLTREELAGLLEPWLGGAAAATGLPLPALIDLRLADRARFDGPGLAAALAREVPTARLDDHGTWLGAVQRTAGLLNGAAAALLALLGGALAVSVVALTRARLRMQRDEVEILHLIGANDGYIAGLFQRHAFTVVLQGGLIGATLAVAAAAGLAFLLGGIARAPGGVGLIPVLALPPGAWAAVALLPFAAAAIALLAARVTILRALSRMF